MSAKPDGGPAFPVHTPPGNGCGPYTGYGMSLRDYFAAKAMPTCITELERLAGRGQNVLPPGMNAAEAAAVLAYTYADAMIQARNK